MKHPSEVVPHDILLWRDKLRSQKKSAATVAFKLSVVRSFFEYLKAAGVVWSHRLNCRLSLLGARCQPRMCATCCLGRTGRSRKVPGTTR